MLRYFILICSGAGLLACSSVSVQYTGAERMDVNANYERANSIDSMIQPYRKELAAEMEEIIATAPEDFIKGRPNGSLNNWSCDALMAIFAKDVSGVPTIALLNNGGLRNPISKGNVTLGDLFKLMPFDNEVVIVDLPVKALDDLRAYFNANGGESLAGVKLLAGEWRFDNGMERMQCTSVRVITSDYLMNGGDNMAFFEMKTRVEYTGVLLRDAFIQQAKAEKTLNWNNEERYRP